MTTVNSTQYAVALGKNAPAHGAAGNIKVAYSSAATPAAFTTTDTLNMHVLPAGSRVLWSILKCTDIDSGTTITLNVGDSGSASRYFAASTVGQTATNSILVTTGTTVTGVGYLNTADTLVTVVPAAGPATSAGTLELTQFYVIEGQAS